MRAVNLLPAPRAEKRQWTTKSTAVAAGLVFVLVSVAAGFGFVQARSDVSDRQSTLDGLQAEVAQLQASAALSAAETSQMQAHLAAVSAAGSGRMAWDGLLDQLSRVLPQGAWLESLQATGAAVASTPTAATTASATPAPTAAPTGFTVTGKARSQEIVASVLERLALIPALSDVSLQSTQRADVAGKKAVQFTIGANVRSAGGNG